MVVGHCIRRRQPTRCWRSMAFKPTELTSHDTNFQLQTLDFVCFVGNTLQLLGENVNLIRIWSIRWRRRPCVHFCSHFLDCCKHVALFLLESLDRTIQTLQMISLLLENVTMNTKLGLQLTQQVLYRRTIVLTAMLRRTCCVPLDFHSSRRSHCMHSARHGCV